jgi:hypothetical protein
LPAPWLDPDPVPGLARGVSHIVPMLRLTGSCCAEVRIPSGRRPDGILAFRFTQDPMAICGTGACENPVSRASDPARQIVRFALRHIGGLLPHQVEAHAPLRGTSGNLEIRHLISFQRCQTFPEVPDISRRARHFPTCQTFPDVPDIAARSHIVPIVDTRSLGLFDCIAAPEIHTRRLQHMGLEPATGFTPAKALVLSANTTLDDPNVPAASQSR